MSTWTESCIFGCPHLADHEKVGDFLKKQCCQCCGESIYSKSLSKAINTSSLSQKLTLRHFIHQTRESLVKRIILDTGESIKSLKLKVEFSGADIKNIEDFDNTSINHAKKLDDILILIAENYSNEELTRFILMGCKEFSLLKIADSNEAMIWLRNLHDDNYVSLKSVLAPNNDKKYKPIGVHLKAKGWSRVAELNQGINSKEVFIAMEFGIPEKQAYIELVQRVCSSLGYEAKTVEDGTPGDITEKIQAAINRCKFMVADFTRNNRGVYWEAGYATGIGRKVFCTVKLDSLDNGGEKVEDEESKAKRLHFDTRNKNHLIWKDKPDEIEDKLRDAIQAVIDVKKGS